ncbi:hypothetical protein K523DRAFT_422445 [Schizophyllum commune Tattone D]|nr:hypothetical protein K523DRAFT_422445 [Schizophyllum commune Tattone D]
MGALSATSSLKFQTYDPSTARQKRTPVPGTAVLRLATPAQSNSRVNPSPAAPSETYAGVLSSRAQTPKDPTVNAEALAYPSPTTPIVPASDSLASYPPSTQFGGSSRATPASKRRGSRFSRIVDVMREENVSVPEFLLYILQSPWLSDVLSEAREVTRRRHEELLRSDENI